MDVDAIAAAIAARYAPGQVVPPAGLGNVRTATSDLPNRLGPLPAVLVFPDSGTFEIGGGSRLGDHRFLARFYFAKVKDLPRELNACRRWVTVLIDQHRTSMQLGGTVVAVRTLGWRIVTLPYAGADHTGIELNLQVVTADAWAPTA